MSEIILHHYPQSPVAEKVRTGLGLKQLAWRSVEQNRLPDRPELLAMTGGYRRIPVLQIGADIYCDSQCILMELERRHPHPTFFPNNGAGLPFALSRWTDGPIFDLAFRLAFAPAAASLPPELVADRTRLYLGPRSDLAKEAADLPHTLSQLRAQLGWAETRLSTGRRLMLADDPGMPDLLLWYLYWFIETRYPKAGDLLAEFPLLRAWADRVRAIGHGASSPMAPAEALAIARAAEPSTPEAADPRDPQGLSLGMTVAVTPLGDGGDAPVEGRIKSVSRDAIALAREHPACGRVVVHFPRVGYRVSPR
jgi:glutathione S-transferase